MSVFIAQVEGCYSTNIIGVFSTYEFAEDAIKAYLNDMLTDKMKVIEVLEGIKEKGYGEVRNDEYFIEQYEIDR